MSRLIDRILDEFKDINHAYNDSSKYDTLKSMLNDAAEVVHGEWIKEDFVLTSYYPQYQWWYCSECGHILRGFNRDVLTNYCPECGAKMDGKEQNDE